MDNTEIRLNMTQVETVSRKINDEIGVAEQ